MEQETAGNRIIAEFMGMQYDRESALMRVYIDGEESTLFHCSWHPEYKEHSNYLAWEFAPNENWCQLMPVVEKINKTWDAFDDSFEDDEAQPEYIIQVLRSSVAHVDIKTAHNCCTQFIQWFNSQQINKKEV